jgi:aminoglycoside phosphotransferase (APT) family kinase protein
MGDDIDEAAGTDAGDGPAGDDLNPGTPWRREADEVARPLAEWAAYQLDEPVEIVDVGSPGNGMSSETMLFSVRRVSGATEPYAARLAPKPDVYPVFAEYDLERQARCMQLVRAHTDVPAPEVRWVETDPKWLGTPFLVMPRIEGEAPPDIPPYVFGGWVCDATAEQRARMERASVSVLARLHRITPETADLSFLARPERGRSAMDQQLGHERWYYEWARGDVRYPLIEATFDWLDRNRPEEGPAVFNWGDARIGNMLYREFEPVAVLDWEMATVGPAEVDLAWMIFLDRFFDDMAVRFGVPTALDGFMDRATVVTLYEELSGHAVHALEWYEVFAALRFATVSVRTSTRGIAYGQMEPPADPDDLIMFRNLLEQMLDGSYWS